MLAVAVEYFKEAGMVAIPVWRMAHDAGASLAGAARRLGVEAVLLGTSQRGAVWHLLRGNVLRSLVRELPRRHARLDRELTGRAGPMPAKTPAPRIRRPLALPATGARPSPTTRRRSGWSPSSPASAAWPAATSICRT